jgi:peptidoglycan/xylan/chitin deacetylase (PgdA/CDA1 family)
MNLNTVLRSLSPLIRPFYSGLGLVLYLHRVLPAGAEQHPYVSLSITPEQLDASLDYFARRGYQPISLGDLSLILRGEKKLERRFVVYTFDDGYLDNLTQALPVFQKHQAPLAVNLITGFPERKVVLWWYLLEELVTGSQRIEFEFDGQEYGFDCTTTEGKRQAFKQIRQMLKYSNVQTHPQLLQSIFRAHSLDLFRLTEQLTLSWEQARQLADDPLVTIGAHTLNHYVLGQLSDEEARAEIAESKRLLEEKLARPIDYLAYPYGNRNEIGPREYRLAQESGFKLALTTRYGNLFPAHAGHMYSLPRNEVSADEMTGQLDLLSSGALAMRVNRGKKISS